MNLESIWAQIEQDQTWRTDEIRFFDNQVAKVAIAEQDKFRRANVLLLYSHYEGFCKFTFTVYVNTLNAEQIKGSDANFSLVALSLDSIFKVLRNPQIKSPEFKRALPDDRKLHLFARDKEFLEGSVDFLSRTISIPDGVVDTESNLKPIVLRKNLFRLGFPHDGLESVEGDISQLLNRRNEIAHGGSGVGVTDKEYKRLRTVAIHVMNSVKRYVMHALTNKEYLRS